MEISSDNSIRHRNLLGSWGPPAAAAAAIFLLSSIPGDRLPGHPGYLNVVAHLLEYGILGFLLSRAFLSSGLTRTRTTTILAVTAVCLGYGVLDELHQFITPYRLFDVYDLAADTVGALLSSIIYTVQAMWRIP